MRDIRRDYFIGWRLFTNHAGQRRADLYFRISKAVSIRHSGAAQQTNNPKVRPDTHSLAS